MRKKDEQKRKRILDAAVKVFAEKGFFHSKVSEIAAEASVADGTIYIYFRNKDDLLISIFEEKMREVIRQFRNSISRELDARSRMHLLIKLHLSEFEANPDMAAVFMVELRQSSRFMREYEKQELREYVDLIGEILDEGVAEGSFRPGLSTGIAKRMIFGTLDEVVSTWVLGGRKHDLAVLAEGIADMFFKGIGAETCCRE